MIRLNVFIEVSAPQRTQVIEIARRLVAHSLQDSGCIAYDLFESSTRSNVLMICETWQDEASLTVHSQAEHFKALVPRLHELARMKTERFVF